MEKCSSPLPEWQPLVRQFRPALWFPSSSSSSSSSSPSSSSSSSSSSSLLSWKDTLLFSFLLSSAKDAQVPTAKKPVILKRHTT
ncbi:MAG: hypothetical protein FJ266_14795 [Planctomycetes bacterium]|nr:hypothetical protein [Planctomycetota bacterium]